MDVQVSALGVVLAAVSSMIIGMVWYAKPVFGNTWQKLVKLDDKNMQKGAAKAISLTFLLSFVTAYVLAHVSYLSNFFFGNSFFQDSVMTAFWLWLGIAAARIATHDLFEKRPTTLTLLTITHEMVTLLVMGAVIGLIGV
jgi:hypothetical protein